MARLLALPQGAALGAQSTETVPMLDDMTDGERVSLLTRRLAEAEQRATVAESALAMAVGERNRADRRYTSVCWSLVHRDRRLHALMSAAEDVIESVGCGDQFSAAICGMRNALDGAEQAAPTAADVLFVTPALQAMADAVRADRKVVAGLRHNPGGPADVACRVSEAVLVDALLALLPPRAREGE